MEIPLLRGRVFTEQDGPNTPPAALISQVTAQKLWGAEEALGHMIRLVGSGKQFTVVGIVGDVHSAALNQEPAPTMYFPASMRVWPLMDIVVRTEMDPGAAVSAVRLKLHELDPELPMSNIRTMDEWISNNAAQPRLNTLLLGIFAFVALLIAAIGIFGVLTYSVNRRTREIGVRMALGAQQTNVLRLVVREGVLVALAGIAAGLAGAFALSRALATLLFGVNPRDPATFAAVAGVLVIVALVSCYLPARRATRVDPIVALRYE
jgi:putative ABC transport system permease protein